MLIRNLIKTADEGSYAARADRNIQTGRVLIIDSTAREAILDVGMVNALGNAVYMVGVPYSPQAIPRSQDTVALLRTNSSPYSHVIGGGAAVGGANSGQIVTSAGVNSIKKTGEASGQQGDLILDPGTGITITRTSKTFSIAEAHSGILGGLLGTGVSLTLNGESYNYQYNTGLGADTNVTLPNLVLASGTDTALEYKFTNFSNKTVTVTANTTTFTNTIETVASYSLGPGHYATFLGIQGTGSDGVWRITNVNFRLIPGLTHAGTTYTLAITDLGTSVDLTSASAVTVTVPPHSSVAFPVDALIEITQLGAGQVTLAAGAGVTLDAGGGLSIPYQYGALRLRQQATDVWVVSNPASATGSGAAPDSAHYVTTQAESGLSAEFSLGSLTSGMLKHTVSGSVSTPATATEGTDYYKPTGTDVAVADGGTGSSTAGGARTNLGLVIGTDVEAHDADLTTIAGLTATTDNFLQAKSSAWASRTPTQVTADLIAVVGDSGSGGTKGLVPAPAAGDAAAGKFFKADGTFAVPPASAETFVANAQTGSYTLVLTDAGKCIEVTNAGAPNVTIPPNASVAFALGTIIKVEQRGSGVVHVINGSGVTIHSRGGLSGTNGQYAEITLRQSALDLWIISGDMG